MNDEADKRCETHDADAIGACGQCGKPICEQCRREFGYFCGESCLNQSLGTVDHASKAKLENSMRSFHLVTRIIKYALLAVFLFLLVGAGWLVWTRFLDPAGNVVWQWNHSFKYERLTLLKSDAKEIVLKIAGEVVAVDPKVGGEIRSAANPKIAGFTRVVKKYSTGVLFVNQDSAAMIGYDGALKWRTNMGGAISDAAAGVSVLMTCVAVEASRKQKEVMGEYVEIVEYDHYLVCVAVVDGRVLGKRKLNKSMSFANNLCVGERCFVFSASEAVNDRFYTVLRVGDLATSKTIWKIKLDAGVGWGPRIIKNSIVFQAGSTLMAFSMDGKSKLWSLPVKGYFLADEMKITNDYLFVSGSETIACVDLKSNKVLWNAKPPFYPESFEYDNGRVFISGTITSKRQSSSSEVKLPKRFKQLQDDDVIKGIVGSGGGFGSKLKYDGVIVCYDAKTGKETWRVNGIRGSLVARAGRVMVVTDTAVTSKMNISNKGKGLSIIRQLDPEDGDVLYKRTNLLGLMKPFMIIDGKLIAVEFERLNSGIGGLSMGGGDDLNCFGLAAIELK